MNRSAGLDELLLRAHERLAAPTPDAALDPLLVVSDFALDVLCGEAGLRGDVLAAFVSDDAPAADRWLAPADDADDAEWQRALRRFRRRESLRLIARDLAGRDDVDATLQGATALAETCLAIALAQATRRIVERHGELLAADGSAIAPVIFGMGKLGGGELNFSSDIDLIVAYREDGESHGARGLPAEDWMHRLVQRLVQLLSTVTEDGFVFRVDLRLRPFGTAGRLALNFNAMEQYYQREGRDWERYAWAKARPVAGDVASGAQLIASLRPFVFRRYLDYNAIDGLREMKALIDLEVARKDLEDHLKLGPGGIREIEFMVQLVQLIYGGREPGLRVPGMLAALAAATALGHFDGAARAELEAAYRHLRRVENRVQMLRDQQTHSLPETALDRERLALGLGYPALADFLVELGAHRERVARRFAAVLAPRRRAIAAADEAYRLAWLSISESRPVDALPPFGDDAVAELNGLARASAIRNLEPKARQRLDHLLPRLLAAAARATLPDAALVRVARLLLAVAGRPSYLALLDERPAARERVVEVFAASAFLAERVIAHPLLLDELLDERGSGHESPAAALRRDLARRRVDRADPEDALALLHEERQAAAFRLGLAFLSGRIDADRCAAGLAEIAEVMVEAALAMAEADALAQFGAIAGREAARGMAVLGYGSLGGGELGFASDLDLVFVFDGALADRHTLGTREVEGSRYFARVAQRVMHWLTTPTRAGPLYEIDVRLRPDGGKGLLVTTLESFTDYQEQRAWPFEHQALVRARVVAGDQALAATIADVRRRVLAKPRTAEALVPEVRRLRRKWREELDRSSTTRFDLKQGPGGLVDIEFLLQVSVLLGAAGVPGCDWSSRSAALIAELSSRGLLAVSDAAALAAAHAAFVDAGLRATLDVGPRVVARTPPLEAHAAAVLAIVGRVGLV